MSSDRKSPAGGQKSDGRTETELEWEAVAHRLLQQEMARKRESISEELYGIEGALSTHNEGEAGVSEAFATAVLRVAEHLSHVTHDLKDTPLLDEDRANTYIHLFELMMTASSGTGWGGTVEDWEDTLERLKRMPPADLEARESASGEGGDTPAGKGLNHYVTGSVTTDQMRFSSEGTMSGALLEPEDVDSVTAEAYCSYDEVVLAVDGGGERGSLSLGIDLTPAEADEIGAALEDAADRIREHGGDTNGGGE